MNEDLVTSVINNLKYSCDHIFFSLIIANQWNNEAYNVPPMIWTRLMWHLNLVIDKWKELGKPEIPIYFHYILDQQNGPFLDTRQFDKLSYKEKNKGEKND